eukprot:TRINITY_DN1441_c0_g2_i1.p1 TRINITY_DN1441_c0_g2~~TRINITY_DN1441_c0_g2_i1.p1  ORF type:complete len:731 (+),score=215.85 TRINITY_DN1441_c0_g2_i1:115-2307(+)
MPVAACAMDPYDDSVAVSDPYAALAAECDEAVVLDEEEFEEVDLSPPAKRLRTGAEASGEHASDEFLAAATAELVQEVQEVELLLAQAQAEEEAATAAAQQQALAAEPEAQLHETQGEFSSEAALDEAPPPDTGGGGGAGFDDVLETIEVGSVSPCTPRDVPQDEEGRADEPGVTADETEAPGAYASAAPDSTVSGSCEPAPTPFLRVASKPLARPKPKPVVRPARLGMAAIERSPMLAAGEPSDQTVGEEEQALGELPCERPVEMAGDVAGEEDDDVEFICEEKTGDAFAWSRGEGDADDVLSEDPEDDGTEAPRWLVLAEPGAEDVTVSLDAESSASLLDGVDPKEAGGEEAEKKAIEETCPTLWQYIVGHPQAWVTAKRKRPQAKGRFFSGQEKSEDVMADKVVTGCWACGRLDHESHECVFKRCFTCSEQGHEVSECTLRAPKTCWRCGRRGCKGPEECPEVQRKEAANSVDEPVFCRCVNCGEEGHLNCGAVSSTSSRDDGSHQGWPPNAWGGEWSPQGAAAHMQPNLQSWQRQVFMAAAAGMANGWTPPAGDGNGWQQSNQPRWQKKQAAVMQQDWRRQGRGREDHSRQAEDYQASRANAHAAWGDDQEEGEEVVEEENGAYLAEDAEYEDDSSGGHGSNRGRRSAWQNNGHWRQNHQSGGGGGGGGGGGWRQNSGSGNWGRNNGSGGGGHKNWSPGGVIKAWAGGSAGGHGWSGQNRGNWRRR